MVQFVDIAKSRGCSAPADMMKLIHEHDLHSTFPNVSIHSALNVHVSSGFKLFRRTLIQQNGADEKKKNFAARLSAMQRLCVESDVLGKVSFIPERQVGS